MLTRPDPFSRKKLPPLATAGAPYRPLESRAPAPTGPRVQVGLAKPAPTSTVLGVPLSEMGYRSAGWTGAATESECSSMGGTYTAPSGGGRVGTCTTAGEGGTPNTGPDCWATPIPPECGSASDYAKESTSSDWNAVGTIQAIGRGAADILTAWSNYDMRSRTADREDQRLQLQQQGAQLDRDTRLAIAELQARGTAEAARVAADLQAALARQSEAGFAKTALYVGAGLLGVTVIGVVAYKVLAPHKNPARGRRMYRKGKR